jgi:type II secretory pathway pseudopilin PulG
VTPKKGLSLITLIITIVVIMILAGAIVITLLNSDILSEAKEAKFKSDMKTFEHSLNLRITSEILQDPSFIQDSINAVRTPQDETQKNILEVIPEVKGDYESKVEVESSKVIYSGSDYDEKVWTCELGMNVKGESCDDLQVDDGQEEIVEHDFVVDVGGVKHYQPNISSFDKETTYYITFNFGDEQKTSIKEAPPEDWYDYAQQKWANVVVENNGKQLYLTWIPRYAYKITNYDKQSFSSTPPADLAPIDIRFVDKDNMDLNSEEYVVYDDTEPVVENNSQTNYVTHPAFTVDRTDTEQENVELSGIWVSKFEATDVKVRLDSFTINGMLNSTTVQVTTVPNSGAGIIPYTYEYYINENPTPIKIGLATETITGLLPNSINTISVKAKNADGIYTAALTRSVLMIADDNDVDMNPPDLTGFNPDTTSYLTFNYGDEQKTSINEPAPADWYNYKEQRWANIITESNGKKVYLVWIPRYEYRIHSLEGSNSGQMDIQFIRTDKVVPTEGYTIHPAFSVNRDDTSQEKMELPGIWVSKFESTEIKAILNDFAVESITHNSVDVSVTPSSTGGIDPATYEYYVNEGETPVKIGTANETITGLDPNTIYTIKVRAKSLEGFYTAYLTRSFMTLQSPAIENAPDLTGFNPDTTSYVTFNSGAEQLTSINEVAPTDWYDYAQKKWANIVTESNGRKTYLVWIPRYEYRINTLASNDYGQMDIQFISVSKTTPSAGYTIHPAFSVNRDDTSQEKVELPGIWVSKFEATEIKLILTSLTVTPQTDGRSVKVDTVAPSTSGVDANGYEYYLNDDTSPIKVGTASEIITGLQPNTIYTIRVRAKDATGNYTAYLTRSTTTLSAPDATTANQPDLSRFNSNTTYYITYEGGNEVKTSINNPAPANWYDYVNKQWANILVENNGKKVYLVWIPRYEYQIQTVTSEYGLMDIRFIDTSKTVADAGYMIHPAFTLNRQDTGQSNVELSGIWISKFEATEIKAILNNFIVSEIYDTSVKVVTTPSSGGEIDPNTYEYYINDEASPRKIGTATDIIEGLSPNTIYTIKVRAKNTQGYYSIFNKIVYDN